jgi:hypothetical protein
LRISRTSRSLYLARYRRGSRPGCRPVWARPAIISRTLAIWATAMYDAQAAYDPKAVGSRLGSSLRRRPRSIRWPTKRSPSVMPRIGHCSLPIQTPATTSRR